MKSLKVLAITLLAAFGVTAVSAQVRHDERNHVVVRHHRHAMRHRIMMHHHHDDRG